MYSIVLAQIKNLATPSLTGDGVTFFSAFIPRMISIIFVVGVVAFMIMFLLGGVKWIMSGGDKTQVESARTQILNALIGVVVLFGVYAIARFMKSVFGIELINIDLSPILPTVSI